MRKSIATVSLGGKLTDKLEAIAAAGFDGVEIFEPNLLSYQGAAREIGRYAAGWRRSPVPSYALKAI